MKWDNESIWKDNGHVRKLLSSQTELYTAEIKENCDDAWYWWVDKLKDFRDAEGWEVCQEDAEEAVHQALKRWGILEDRIVEVRPVPQHVKDRIVELENRYEEARDAGRLPVTASYLSNGLQHLHECHPDGCMPWSAGWLGAQVLGVLDEVLQEMKETALDHIGAKYLKEAADELGEIVYEEEGGTSVDVSPSVRRWLLNRVDELEGAKTKP